MSTSFEVFRYICSPLNKIKRTNNHYIKWTEVTVLAMDNQKLFLKMRLNLKLKSIVLHIRRLSHWIVRGARSLLWEIDFPFFFARA